MKKHDIQSTLAALKTESENIDSRDPDSMESINQLINKLEQQLSEPNIDDHQNLIDHLNDVILKFEVNNPSITAIANDLMVKLAGLGV